VRALIGEHVETIETLIEASRKGDVDAAFEAFLLDAQVRRLQTERARDMFAELVAAEEAYLDGWDLDGSEVLAESGEH
jgi:alpha-galactosidase